MKLYRILFISALVTVLSCSREMVDQAGPDQIAVDQEEADEKPVTEINVNILPIEIEPETKTSVSTSGKFSWVANDKLGFWPDAQDVQYGSPQQSLFYVDESSEGSENANFKANGWGLLRGKKYYAYYPYDSGASCNSVAISYLGQNIISNGSSDNLGYFDFLHASFTMPQTGSDIIDFGHLGGIIRLTLNFDSEFAATSFTGLTISTDSQIFVESARYNPSSDEISYQSTVMKNNLSLSLNSGNGISCNADNQIVAYMMLNPTAWKDKTITVTAVSSGDIQFVGEFCPTKDLAASKGQAFSVNMECTDSVIDLSRDECANCYIVTSAGDYKFRSVKGNDPSLDKGDNIASVSVLWESQGTSTAPANGSIISEVWYKDHYIYFSTNSTFKAGNAVIVAKNSKGTVLWSWHIWCTSEVPGVEEYLNNAGHLMDRNIGALAKTGDLSAGLFYQWGRKDPFPGTASISSKTRMAATLSFSSQQSSTGITVSKGYNNPTTFYYNASSPLDWIWPVNGVCDVTNRTWYDAKGGKTIHDPCPPGYKVTSGSKSSSDSGKGFYATALGFNYRVSINDYTATTPSGDVIFENNAIKVPIVSGYAYYPATGCLNDSNGQFNYVGDHVFIWTDYPGGYDGSNWHNEYSSVFDFNVLSTGSSAGTGHLTVNWNSGRSCGKSVRCELIKMDKTGSTKANEAFVSVNGSW